METAALAGSRQPFADGWGRRPNGQCRESSANVQICRLAARCVSEGDREMGGLPSASSEGWRDFCKALFARNQRTAFGRAKSLRTGGNGVGRSTSAFSACRPEPDGPLSAPVATFLYYARSATQHAITRCFPKFATCCKFLEDAPGNFAAGKKHSFRKHYNGLVVRLAD